MATRRDCLRRSLVAGLAASAGAGCAAAVAASRRAVLAVAGEAALRAPRPGFKASTIALQITAARDARLVGARLQSARAVELRTMRREGSLVAAERVAAIDLPAGVPVATRVEPGAFHLLALGLAPSLHEGQRLRLMLDLQDKASGAVQTVSTLALVLPARGVHADDAH